MEPLTPNSTRRPTVPPIELVAARLRELRRAASVLASTPDVVSGVEDELRRVTGEYDDWLVIAAGQVGLPADPEFVTAPLPTATRLDLEQAIVERGWAL